MFSKISSLKIIILLLSLFFIFACSKKDDSSDSIRAEISSFQKEFNELRRTAVNFMYNNNWFKAIDNLEQALNLKPTEADIYFLLGVSYGHLTSIDDKYANNSKTALETFIRLKPSDPVGYYSLGILKFYNFNNVSEAIDFMDKAISLDAAYEKAYVARGTFCYSDGRFTEAIESYETAIMLSKVDTNKAKYYLNLAKIYKSWGRVEDARYNARQSLKLRSNYPEAIAFLNSL